MAKGVAEIAVNHEEADAVLVSIGFVLGLLAISGEVVSVEVELIHQKQVVVDVV